VAERATTLEPVISGARVVHMYLLIETAGLVARRRKVKGGTGAVQDPECQNHLDVTLDDANIVSGGVLQDDTFHLLAI